MSSMATLQIRTTAKGDNSIVLSTSSKSELVEMAAKRVVVRAVDWAKLGSTIPKAASADFNAFRTRHEVIKGSLAALPEKPVPINWDTYMSSVKNKALVEKFHTAYTQVTIPYPEDTESAKIALEEEEIEAEIVEASKVRKEKIAQMESEIAAIRAQKPYEEILTYEYMDQHPDLKKEADAEIKEIGWR